MQCSKLETAAAAASGALGVVPQPGPDAARVSAVAAPGAEHSGAGAGQATQRAPHRGGVAEDTSGPGHALATH